mgnify:CR=1
INILSSFKDYEHVIIGINVDKMNELLASYKIVQIKNFKNQQRHIALLTKND